MKISKKNKAKGAVPARREENPLLDLRSGIDSLFEDFFSGFGREPMWSVPQFFDWSKGHVAPCVDVTESENEYAFTAELPGIEEKDLSVTLDEDRLSISGEKNTESEERKKDYHLSECSYGRFERSFVMPKGINREHVKAAFKNGILTLTLPKSEEAKSSVKKIEVNAEQKS